MPMQSGWNTWLHFGIKRRVSSSSNSFKHTAHSSVLLPFTVEYTKVGKVSMISEFRPRARRPLTPIGSVNSNLPLLRRSVHCRVYTERKPKMKNTTTRMTMMMAMFLSNLSLENGSADHQVGRVCSYRLITLASNQFSSNSNCKFMTPIQNSNDGVVTGKQSKNKRQYARVKESEDSHKGGVAVGDWIFAMLYYA
ncbi:hypothetical protein G2W53_030966 [Senna tora]|uniref:Uncharacterized protein n=1 Tax=Senna tora TaxID=362788 RepID=A0A834WC23_9FABA|nr:hypothetical protein G2W53_030966 [Senna tora]